jgi:aspartate carbamoyltransferase regulatory subunit
LLIYLSLNCHMDISLDDTYINKKNIDHLSSSHPQKIINKTKMSKRKKKKKIKKIGGVVGVVLLYP